MSLASPFIRIGKHVPAMAAWTWLALLVPCAAYSMLYHSPFVFQLLGYTLLGMLAESLYTLAIKRKRRLVCMGSGLTAALLAASVPPSTPFLPMLLAILFAVWIVKLPMTGLPLRFNAAMAGRLFLMLAYPGYVVNWGTPTADVISTATPQELYRSEGFVLEWPQLLFGKIEGVWEDLLLLVPGSPGETFPLVILLLGALLCWKRISSWRTSSAFLLSFGIATALYGNNPLFSLFSSATIFSAVFIVSDPVSTPMSQGGKIIIGVVIGAANVLIRHYTYYTEAIVYAVLLGNLLSPVADLAMFHLRGKLLLRRVEQP